jgi:hypothetical protein
VVTVRAERFSAYRCRSKERMRGSGPSGSMNGKVNKGNALHPVHGPLCRPQTTN